MQKGDFFPNAESSSKSAALFPVLVFWYYLLFIQHCHWIRTSLLFSLLFMRSCSLDISCWLPRKHSQNLNLNKCSKALFVKHVARKFCFTTVPLLSAKKGGQHFEFHLLGWHGYFPVVTTVGESMHSAEWRMIALHCFLVPGKHKDNLFRTVLSLHMFIWLSVCPPVDHPILQTWFLGSLSNFYFWKHFFPNNFYLPRSFSTFAFLSISGYFILFWALVKFWSKIFSSSQIFFASNRMLLWLNLRIPTPQKHLNCLMSKYKPHVSWVSDREQGVWFHCWFEIHNKADYVAQKLNQANSFLFKTECKKPQKEVREII